MVPICYEESIVNGAGFPCAAYMALATENFIKEFLSGVFSRTRSNGPSGTINPTMTRNYRRQLGFEEMAFTRGEIVKNSANGLLPVEAKEASTRQPLGVPDLRLALGLGGGLLGHMPLIVDQIMSGYVEEELEAERQDYYYYTETSKKTDTNNQVLATDEMDIDEADWDWEGDSSNDKEHLTSLLDECLSMAA